MAPKKAAEAPIVAAPPPDPEVISEQEKLEKWNQRVQALQKKLEEAVRYTSNVEAKQKQLEQQLVGLLEKATEVAANKKVPPQPAVAPVAPAPPSKPPKGPKAAEAPPPPPPEPVLTPREQEEEQRKRTKITNALMGLYKKKRSAAPSNVVAGGAAAAAIERGGGTLTPRGGAGDGAVDVPSDSPRSPTSNAAGGEFFPKPHDVPVDLWTTMLGLREERLQVEAQIATAKTCLVQGTLHLKQLQSMQNVVRYAVVGSEGGLKRATVKCEERHLREQAAARESVAQASPAPAPPAAKKK